MIFTRVQFIVLNFIIMACTGTKPLPPIQPGTAETWQQSPHPTTTKIRVITGLSERSLRSKVKQALDDKGYRINSGEFTTPKFEINDEGGVEEVVNRYDTEPRSLSNAQSFYRLHISIQDSVVTFSGEIGTSNDVILNGNDNNINWKTLVSGENFNPAFNRMNDVALVFTDAKRLFNKFD